MAGIPGEDLVILLPLLSMRNVNKQNLEGLSHVVTDALLRKVMATVFGELCSTTLNKCYKGVLKKTSV